MAFLFGRTRSLSWLEDVPNDALVDLDRSMARGGGVVATVGHSQSELGLALGLESECHVIDLRLVRSPV